MTSKTARVLLVEDDPGDVELIRASLKGSKLGIVMECVVDGQECMEYLRKTGKYANATLPDIILLDLNMPKKDGRQVLAEIKSDPFLKKIPVVVLTTSDADMDIEKTYGLGANCYVTKSVDFFQFKKIINEVSEFWFTTVKLPDGKI